ncbi:MAG TPA: sulfite exporter TauE/SafE family protein [Gemmatimonadales bacterium]|nr:sulfite exporter TauE/SafE family protein [Gemmatimonadales bacterium]
MTVVYVIIGLVAGILAGMFGIGGGLLIVPALVFIARMPILVATGTSLGALVLPAGLLGAIVYYRAGHLNVPAALLIALGLFVGAYVGAEVAHTLKTATVTRLFAVFLVLVAVRLWFEA